MGKIQILEGGMQTSVQDKGRFGYQTYGMPVSGAMDQYSLQLANWLVSNKAFEACLEICLIAPKFEVLEDCTMGIAGAFLTCFRNNKKIDIYKTQYLKRGDVIHFGAIERGARAYIAFAGGIELPNIMESKSTYIRGNVGGYKGKAMEKDDVLVINKTSAKVSRKKLPKAYIPQLNREAIARVIPGPEVFRFKFDGLVTFLTSTYVVSNDSDRMGYRLNGAKVEHEDNADITSSGIAMGTIQIPGDGEPIVMMSDHQTIGGYTKIANVISVDIPILAQLKPGDVIRFQEVTLQHAHDLMRERKENLEALYRKRSFWPF